MQLRDAVLADLPVLLEFEQGIVAAERPFDATLKTGEIHYYDIAELITSDNSTVIVAEHQGEIIASGYAQLRDSKAYLVHQRHAYLGFMYVSLEQRGQGLIQRIMSALNDWSKAQGVKYVYLDVYAGNESALKAYEKMGFTANLVEMRMALDD